jgi:hypothetical protein
MLLAITKQIVLVVTPTEAAASLSPTIRTAFAQLLQNTSNSRIGLLTTVTCLRSINNRVLVLFFIWLVVFALPSWATWFYIREPLGGPRFSNLPLVRGAFSVSEGRKVLYVPSQFSVKVLYFAQKWPGIRSHMSSDRSD